MADPFWSTDEPVSVPPWMDEMLGDHFESMTLDHVLSFPVDLDEDFTKRLLALGWYQEGDRLLNPKHFPIDD